MGGSLKWLGRETWDWTLGLIYIVAVAAIWIAASYIVQSVVDAGVSPFLITYICNSLFVVYIPIVEVGRFFEDSVENIWFWCKNKEKLSTMHSGDAEVVNLLKESDNVMDPNLLFRHRGDAASRVESRIQDSEIIMPGQDDVITGSGTFVAGESSSKHLDAKGRWTRTQVAKVSLLVCPFWFLAQLTFNLSLKYTTVTSNTILSSTSSLFTFLVSLAFLGEAFNWIKLISVLLCMAGTIIVSLADSGNGVNAIATSPLLGDFLALLSAGLYAIYITLIRKKLPDEKKGEGQASMAQFLGFLGLFNLVLFFPVALILHFTKLEPFHKLTWEQVGLIVGKGLLDNVLSDYLWAKAVLLTTTTVATAGLTIQVPIAAVVDTLTGHAPSLMNYFGAVVVMVGFAGINIPSETCDKPQVTQQEQEAENLSMVDHQHSVLVIGSTPSTS